MVGGNWLKSIFFLFLDHLPGFPNYTFLNFQKKFFSLHPNVQAQLSGNTIFSVVDMKDAYWHVKLSDSSSYLTTFHTPWGRERFFAGNHGKRFCYGIVGKSLQHFQMEMVQSHFQTYAHSEQQYFKIAAIYANDGDYDGCNQEYFNQIRTRFIGYITNNTIIPSILYFILHFIYFL